MTGKDFLMGLRTAENVLESVKEGMPGDWRRMIENESMKGGVNEVELYVGEGLIPLGKVTARIIDKMLRKKDIRRPASDKVWMKVMIGMDVKKIWENIRVKGNSVECENLDFLFRHNRVFNNLTISMFDSRVNKESDVCKDGVENCMHEFFECSMLVFFLRELKS